MEEKKYEAIVEAILFTMGESVELERIAKKHWNLIQNGQKRS